MTGVVVAVVVAPAALGGMYTATNHVAGAGAIPILACGYHPNVAARDLAVFVYSAATK